MIKTNLTASTLALLLAACASTPSENKASFEDAPLTVGVASPEEALTFAQILNGEGLSETLLITGFERNNVTAINLTPLGAVPGADIFAAIASLDHEMLTDLATSQQGAVSFERAALLSAAGSATRHIGSGTNFPEHAEETLSDNVFNFPKFGAATPSVTTVALSEGVLLDYEVEICVRFDRDIMSIDNFDAAKKGFFLCADFTDRAMLSRLVDPDNFDSGTGFTDSKSGPNFFPTGPFLVIPNDWKAFVTNERMGTYRNGIMKQDARGGEMTFDFRQLVKKVLSDTTSTRFIYRGEPQTLVVDDKIFEGQALMSGTSEGVIFMPPTRGDIIGGAAKYLLTLGFLRGRSPTETIIESFIEGELKSKRYLQVGETVEYASSSMGVITIEVN